MATIHELQTMAHEIAKAHGWWGHKRNDGELIALMRSELSEALEALRVPDMPHVGEELADTVIRIMDFCEARGIDLEEQIIRKMAINNKRPHRHGGKAF